MTNVRRPAAPPDDRAIAIEQVSVDVAPGVTVCIERGGFTAVAIFDL